MSVDRRIQELSRRHAKLDQQIREEEKRPSADITTVKSLKREKLRLKEQIGELRTG